jgi:hypothetical protein
MRADAAESSVAVDIPPAAFRPKDAARYLGVSETTLRYLPITPLRLFVTGHRKPIVLYLRTDLDQWLAAEARKRPAASY